jgi:hypothetical protein
MKTLETINEKISGWLWLVLLVVLGVASICSIRWISPFFHMSSTFGTSRDQSYALILGFAILAVLFFTLLFVKNKVTRSWNFLLKSSTFVLFIGLIISSLFASDKPLAIFTAGGLAVGIALMYATYRLADQRWKIQLALIVITSLGATFAARTWIRELYEFDQTWQNYVETRNEFWAKQGKDLDDPTVKMFEARMKSRDNGGFFFHGNLGGMYLATAFIVSLTLVGQRWSQRRQRYGGPWLAIAVLLSLFILSALILTMSKGAIASTAIGLFLIAVICRWGSAMRRHFRLTVILTVLLMLLSAGVVIGYGVTKKTLPSLSMAYRWQYWVASYHMFKDHPIAGVGSGNFGTYYLKYKLPEAEEEVTSPHNFIVQGFSEFGLIGGVGFLLLPLAIFYHMATRSRGQRVDEILLLENSPSAVTMLLTIGFGIFITLAIFNQAGFQQPMGLVAEYLPYFLIFAATFVMCSLKGDRLERIESEPVVSWTQLCLTIAGVVFVLGDLVNFSLEEPSMQFLFFFLAGLMLATTKIQEQAGNGQTQGEKIGDCPQFRKLAVGGMAVVLAGYVYFMMMPGMCAESAAGRDEKGLVNVDPNADRVYLDYVRLAKMYPYDGYMAAAVGDRLVKIAAGNSQPEWLIREAVDWYDLAGRRSPMAGTFYSRQSQAYLVLAQLATPQREHYMSKAEEAMNDARLRSPMSKSLAMTLGLIYADHIRQLSSGQKEKIAYLAEQARKNFDEAMTIDAALPHDSIRRFSDTQYKMIAGARAFLEGK